MWKRLNLFKKLKRSNARPAAELSDIFRVKYDCFKELLESNAELARIIADVEEKLDGTQVFGMSFVRTQCARAIFHTFRMAKSLNALSGNKYPQVFGAVERLNEAIKGTVRKKLDRRAPEWVMPYSDVNADMVDWVGGKSANLGEVRNRVGLPIPEGFAITTAAFEHFMAANDLLEEIARIKMEIDPSHPETISAASEEVQRVVLSATVPEDLEAAMLEAYDAMMERIAAVSGGNGTEAEKGAAEGGTAPAVSVALRSSAIGEDSDLSYAGQYLSVLNVPRERLATTYKLIVASLYTPRAISYRLNKGVRDEDVSMSVACLQMIRSVASGIIYTRHPFDPLEDNVIISAVWGLGPYAVDGIVTPDGHTVGKTPDLPILSSSVSCKPVKLVADPFGGLHEAQVPEAEQELSCLSPEQVRHLAGYALKLETHYGEPQDVEWALDPSGRFVVLQSRALNIDLKSAPTSEAQVIDDPAHPVLIAGGAAACPGVGSGPVYPVLKEEDLLNFPEGGVIVSKNASPKFMLVMRKAAAIVTDFGSITGHMASLTREFHVPTLLDTRIATGTLAPGTVVTVDATAGRIYAGRVDALLEARPRQDSGIQDTPVYRILKQVSEFIVPLRLIDPKSKEFSAENCRSLHDVMRLVHEFSYVEMFHISDMVSDGSSIAVKLQAHVPLDLYVIDLGGGLDTAHGGRKITPKHVTSAPFGALLEGMLHEELRYHKPRPIEFGGFLSVMSEQMLSPSHHGNERFGDRSYAIISDKYLNFSSRVGYHYSVLDSYCGQTLHKNYITFSFKGGAADEVRRNRRVRSIARILQEIGFQVEVISDRVDARVGRLEAAVIKEKLDLLGRLLLFTRQMDMLMKTEASVDRVADAFLTGDYQMEQVFNGDPRSPS